MRTYRYVFAEDTCRSTGLNCLKVRVPSVVRLSGPSRIVVFNNVE